MLTPSQMTELADYMLKTFNNSKEILGFINLYVYPALRLRTMRSKAPPLTEIDGRKDLALLLDYLADSFESGQFHGFVNSYLWPRCRELALKPDGRRRLDPDSISETMLDANGSALTVREVSRRAEAGETVLSRRTGAIVRWHETKKKWEPLT